MIGNHHFTKHNFFLFGKKNPPKLVFSFKIIYRYISPYFLRCKENKFDRQRGCVNCPDCYNLVLDSVNEQRDKLRELRKVIFFFYVCIIYNML